MVKCQICKCDFEGPMVCVACFGAELGYPVNYSARAIMRELEDENEKLKKEVKALRVQVEHEQRKCYLIKQLAKIAQEQE